MTRTEGESSTGEAPVRVLPGRNRTKADVLVYRDGDRSIAVKDYRRRPAWIRATIGRWLVRRECAAYRTAGDLRGLPRFLGRVSPHALAVEWIEGATLAQRPALGAEPEVLRQLRSLVDSLHARGIALGDLHHRDVVVGDDGIVRVVDLATAWVAPAETARWRRAVFARLAEQDRLAIARIEARSLGRDEDLALDGLDAGAVKRYRRARRLKRWWDRLRRR